MGLTRSNSSLFRTPGFIVSPVGIRGRATKKRKKEKKRREGGKKVIEKERREGRRDKERLEAR